MTNAAQKWKSDLQSWAIPQEILDQAPESPWIHPPMLFNLPEVIVDTPSHQRAREVAPHDVLDIGCGGGLAAFAQSQVVDTVLGVDHQIEMLEMFAANAETRSLKHHEFLGDWPAVATEVPMADVVTCHHVAYNVQDIVPFIQELSWHARKRVVIELPQVHPLSMSAKAWKKFWDLDRPTNPASTDLLNVIREIGYDAQIENWAGAAVRAVALEDEVVFTRIRLCLSRSRDSEIRDFLQAQEKSSTREVSTIWWDV